MLKIKNLVAIPVGYKTLKSAKILFAIERKFIAKYYTQANHCSDSEIKFLDYLFMTY